VQNATTLTLLIILVLAVLKDTQAHRIPNVLTAVGALAGLLLQALSGGTPALLMGFAGLAAGIAILIPFYIARGMGAGDVKLMGAVGAFLGPQAVLVAGISTLIIGAALGVAILAGRLLSPVSPSAQRALFPANPHPRPWFSIRKEKFPYAVAIAAGTIVPLSHQGQLHALADIILSWSAS
jgi:prepilin peptidase CpaA